MGSGPVNNALPKAIAWGAAALGGMMLYNNAGFAKNQADIEETEMVTHNYLHHAQEAYYDYSGNDQLTHWKHMFFNPANWHWVTRPYIHAKNFMGAIWDNIVPISLMAVGLTWSFDKKVTQDLLPAMWKVTSTVGKGIGSALSFAGSTFNDLGWNPFRQWSKNHLRFPRLNPSGKGAVLAGAGLLIYMLHMFKREVTGENREEAFNMFDPAKLE